MVRMASASSRDQALPAADSPLRALAAILVSARPGQWIKNLVLPLPFLFGGALSSARGWTLAAEGLLVFCAITSAIYLINDVVDRERDRVHPVKRRRPLASGRLSASTAIAVAIPLVLAGLAAAFALSWVSADGARSTWRS